MTSNDLSFDELEYDPSAFDDIHPNDLDTEELEAELALEEAALLANQDNVTHNVDTPAVTSAATGEHTVTTKYKDLDSKATEKTGERAAGEGSSTPSSNKEENNKGNRIDGGNWAQGQQHRPNRRNNYRPMNSPHIMGNPMAFPQVAGSPVMAPMMGMGMPYPMMGFPGAANPGIMNFPNTIHINPKFAGNAQMQQEMMMFQQQQQWQQAQQAMAFQRANAMGMPQFYNNQQQRSSPNTQKPHGGYRPNKEVPSTQDDTGAKTGRERNIPNGNTKRRPSQEHASDKKRHQPNNTKTTESLTPKGLSIKGAAHAAYGPPKDVSSSPTIANPAVVGGKSSRLVIGNLAAGVPETELHRLGKVVPGGVKELLIDRPAGKATLSFQTIDAAVTFRRKYNRTLVGGQHITVSFA